MSDTVFTQDEALRAVSLLREMPEGATIFLFRTKDRIGVIRAPIPEDEKDITATVNQLIQSLSITLAEVPTVGQRLASWLGSCIEKAIASVAPEQDDLTWPDGYLFSRAFATTIPDGESAPLANFVMVDLTGEEIRVKPSVISITEVKKGEDA